MKVRKGNVRSMQIASSAETRWIGAHEFRPRLFSAYAADLIHGSVGLA